MQTSQFDGFENKKINLQAGLKVEKNNAKNQIKIGCSKEQISFDIKLQLPN